MRVTLSLSLCASATAFSSLVLPPVQRPVTYSGRATAVKRQARFAFSLDRTSRQEQDVASAGSLQQGSIKTLQPSFRKQFDIALREARVGNVSEARIMLEELTALRPKDGHLWMQRFLLERRRGSLELAESVLREGLQENPTNGRLCQALGDLYKSQGQVQDARKVFRQVMDIDSALVSVYVSWGWMEAEASRKSLARALFRQGLRMDPRNPRLYHGLGVLEDRLGNSDEARQLLLQGLEVSPENPALLHALGVLEFKKDRVASARQYFREAIETANWSIAYLSLAQLEELQNRVLEARRIYQEAIQTQRRAPVQLWQAWARMEEKSGNGLLAACQVYRQATQAHRKDYKLWVEWAKLEDRLNNTQFCRSLFARAVEEAPLAVYPYHCWALFEQRQGDTQLALDLFAEGAATRSKNYRQLVPLLHAWAVLEWKNGDLEQARALFNRAVSLSEKNIPWLLVWVARFEADCGNLVLARHFFARSVNAAPLDGSLWRYWSQFELEQGLAKNADQLQRRGMEMDNVKRLVTTLDDPARAPFIRAFERRREDGTRRLS